MKCAVDRLYQMRVGNNSLPVAVAGQTKIMAKDQLEIGAGFQFNNAAFIVMKKIVLEKIISCLRPHYPDFATLHTVVYRLMDFGSW